jgi:hypothetical protein
LILFKDDGDFQSRVDVFSVLTVHKIKLAPKLTILLRMA